MAQAGGHLHDTIRIERWVSFARNTKVRPGER